MSSDRGININRVDIELNNPNGYKTVKSIIKAIQAGEIDIKTSIESFNETYNNELCTALNGIGITDIRYHGNYTLYKEDGTYMLSGDRDHDQFLTSDDMNELQYETLMSCYHQGQCHGDTLAASEIIGIEDYDKALEYLLDIGLDEDKFKYDDGTNDEDEILLYYLWIISGDIQELEDTESVEVV